MSKTIQTPPDKLDFALFRDAVDKQIQAMLKKDLVWVRSKISGDALYALYLDSYPSEVNGIFRARKHYDGNYDKNYIRRLGNVVGIDKNGTICMYRHHIYQYGFFYVYLMLISTMVLIHLIYCHLKLLNQ